LPQPNEPPLELEPPTFSSQSDEVKEKLQLGGADPYGLLELEAKRLGLG
jgi:hypothetical protein